MNPFTYMFAVNYESRQVNDLPNCKLHLVFWVTLLDQFLFQQATDKYQQLSQKLQHRSY